jgi:hypothetical protein
LRKVNAPELLALKHEVGHFCSGNETLDEWLIKRAWKTSKMVQVEPLLYVIEKKLSVTMH